MINAFELYSLIMTVPLQKIASEQFFPCVGFALKSWMFKLDKENPVPLCWETLTNIQGNIKGLKLGNESLKVDRQMLLFTDWCFVSDGIQFTTKSAFR